MNRTPTRCNLCLYLPVLGICNLQKEAAGGRSTGYELLGMPAGNE